MNLTKCPMCSSALVYPDKPVRDSRGPAGDGKMRTVIVNIPCPKCPAKVTVFEKTGALCCFNPGRPLTVRVARS